MHVTEQLKMIENVLKVFCSVRILQVCKDRIEVGKDSIYEEGELVWEGLKRGGERKLEFVKSVPLHHVHHLRP